MITHPRVIFTIVLSLALIALLGEIGTFLLVYAKAEGSLIALLSTFGGTALGALTSMLNNTRTQAGPDAAKVEVTNSPAEPIPTKPQ